MGDVIHPNVVVSMIGLTVLGTVVIVAASLNRWRRGANAESKLERPATNPSFDAIRSGLARVAARSTLLSPPGLLYTPKNGDALEARERVKPSGDAVVVGLEQRTRQRDRPSAFEAMLGHEVSHLELAETRLEIWARRAVLLHFRTLGWSTAIFCLVLGFIDRRGIGSHPSFGGFVPVFDGTIYAGLSSQFTVLLLSSAIVFVYSYYFVVRREHVHDFRGSQLAGTDALADVFAAQRSPAYRPFDASIDFFRLHPNPTARARVIKSRDLILLSAILYPLVMSGLQPLTLLLTSGWREFFGISRETWNFGLTVASGLFLYAVLRADLARLGLGLLLDARRYALLVPIYALVAGLATQVPRIILEILYGLRHEFSVDQIAARIWNGTLVGGGRIALMTAAILGLLAFLNAVRIAAVGETNAGKWSTIGDLLAAILVVGAFTIASLSSPSFMIDVLQFCVPLVFAYAAWFVAACRCQGCGRRRLSAIWTSTRCGCGRDHLTLPKTWTRQSFEVQLSDPNWIAVTPQAKPVGTDRLR
ncbi:hypothetical protein [Bradyrhizobium tropiciagri]|uniref:hypothetical protein n=1 Tax=Bradyrhizobium tropiciagri TaxID=312253 RepID=UPI00067C65AD|nr:hypothetical protein [Bradyrhizobium tropiciagri]